MSKISFNITPEFGKGFKAYTYSTKWEPLTFERAIQYQLKDFLEPKNTFRFIAEFLIYNQPCVVASFQEDYNHLKTKYPDKIVIYLEQIINLWKQHKDNQDLPRVLMAAGLLNATVIR